MTVNSSSQTYEWPFRRVVGATLVFAFVIFCFWLIFRFYEVFFMLFIAIVTGTVIRPVVSWLHQRGIPRIAGVILVYLLMLILVAAFLRLLFPVVFEQAATIAGDVPEYYHDLRLSLLNSPNQFFVSLGMLLPAALPFTGLDPSQQTDQSIVTSAGQILPYLIVAAKVTFAVLVILILTLYWTLDGPRIIKSILLLVPQDQREGISELISDMEARVGFYIAGQGILCLVIGMLALVAYVLIGLPNALVLAIAAGVMEAVPMVGPVLGAIPAGVVALSISPDRLIWVILATVIIQQLENSLLVPRIMSKTVGVNPFVTLLALFAFGSLFGIAGALMAIPMAAIIQVALNHYVFQPVRVEMEISEGRDYTSRLRYEAQDLIQDLRKQSRNKKRGSDENVVQVEQVMDEIETITSNLDALLAQLNNSDAE
jgi:predicted PurR-regulated permease PerM